MYRIETSEAKETIVERTLEFLTEAHRFIGARENSSVCMLYSAMTHHLGWDTMNAAVRLGILRRNGRTWHWMIASRPNLALAEQVVKERRRLAQGGGLLSPNAASRILNKAVTTKGRPMKVVHSGHRRGRVGPYGRSVAIRAAGVKRAAARA